MDSRVAKSTVGIVGVGRFLPETVRDRSWWPTEVTERWRERAAVAPGIDTSAMSEDQRMVASAIERLRGDVFQGADRQHVLRDGQTATDIEVLAATDALQSTGVAASQIDLLLTHSGVPDFLGTNAACTVHDRLGLRSDCMALQIEASSASFLVQAALAEQAIRCGNARYALLVQSSTYTRLLPPDAPYSPWMGDGATAVIVGPVAEGHGFLSWAHRTDGANGHTFVTGIPGKRWFDDGRIIAHPASPAAALRTFLSLVTFAREACSEALEKAGVDARDIAFYASHQATAWFREVTQTALDLTRARFVDTFAETASVYSANIPLCLHRGQRDGLLAKGDLVLMFSSGSGATYSCGVMKWAA